jgi:hypothetical protein
MGPTGEKILNFEMLTSSECSSCLGTAILNSEWGLAVNFESYRLELPLINRLLCGS